MSLERSPVLPLPSSTLPSPPSSPSSLLTPLLSLPPFLLPYPSLSPLHSQLDCSHKVATISSNISLITVAAARGAPIGQAWVTGLPLQSPDLNDKNYEGVGHHIGN